MCLDLIYQYGIGGQPHSLYEDQLRLSNLPN